MGLGKAAMPKAEFQVSQCVPIQKGLQSLPNKLFSIVKQVSNSVTGKKLSQNQPFFSKGRNIFPFSISLS